MHEKNCTPCCRSTYYKRENSQWRKCKNCKQTSNKTSNGVCNCGTTKGFVQNLKDKIVRLQNDRLQLGKRPLKKKQKDYYCLMLRKINNLDKKLENLENLFISHLNHTSTDMLRSNDNEPFYNYLDFYESVRSLVDVANKLKQDILHKKCDNHTTNIADRIHILDSELRNLYIYLDQLQNVSNEIQDPKQFFVNEHYCCKQTSCSFIPQVGIANDLNELRKQNINNRSSKKHSNVKLKNYNYANPSSQYMEYYGVKDKNSVIDLVGCQCSKCNIYTQIHYSPERCDYSNMQPLSQNSACSCKFCKLGRRPNPKDMNVFVSQRNSSCSCELCVNKLQNMSNNYKKSCNTKIKLIKQTNNNGGEVLTTISQGNEENSLCDELHISYHDIPPNKGNKRKKRKNKKNLIVNENIEYVITESPYSSPERPVSKTVSVAKSEEIIVMEENEETSTNGNGSGSKKQKSRNDRLVYYELAPDVSVVSKKRTSKKIYNGDLESNSATANLSMKKVNYNASRNNNKPHKENTKGKHYFVIEQPPPEKKFMRIMKNKKYFQGDVRNVLSNSSDSLAHEQKNKYLKVKSNKRIEVENNNGIKSKHLHITFHKKKDCGSFEEEGLVKPRYQHNCCNGSHCYYKKYGHFCDYHNPRHNEKMSYQKRTPSFHSQKHELINYDSFDSFEENESDSDNSSTPCRVLFCSDPNCIEKLDSDELIMLLNNEELAACWESPYSLDIKESVKDFKSDHCDRCTVKEKTISVTPHKPKHKNNKNKERIIIKKEIIECSNCKNKRANDQKGLKQNKSKLKEKGEERKKQTNNNMKNNSNNSNVGDQNTKYSPEVRQNFRDTSKTQNFNETHQNSLLKNKLQDNSKPLLNPNGGFEHEYNYKRTEIKVEHRKEINKEGVQKFEQHKNENDQDNSESQNSDNINIGKRRKNKSMTVEQAAVDQKSMFKTLKVSDNDTSQSIELPGFGNTININIERGPLPLKYVSDQLVNKQSKSEIVQFMTISNIGAKGKNGGNGDYVSKKIDTKESKAVNSYETTNKSSRSPILSVDMMENFMLNLAQQPKENILRNKANLGRISMLNSLEKKSNSVLELTRIGDRGKLDLMAVKSDVFTGQEALNKVEHTKWNTQKINYNKFDNVHMYTAITQDLNGEDDKDLKQKDKVDQKKDLSVGHETIKRSTEILMANENFSYSFESEQKLPSLKKLQTSKKSKKKHYEPKLSVAGLRSYGKRNRLKYNKNFGLSLSRVSSIDFETVEQSKVCCKNKFPLNNIKKERRSRKIKHNTEPEITVRHGKNPQIEISVDEEYLNEIQISTNDSSNFRYKVASVSNYLSSTVTADSSYSTLNWEKVANKLKENNC